MIRLFKIYIYPDLLKSHKYLCNSLELDYSDFIIKTLDPVHFNLQIISDETQKKNLDNTEWIVVKENNLREIKDEINKKIFLYAEKKRNIINHFAQKNLHDLSDGETPSKMKNYGDVFSRLSQTGQFLEKINFLIDSLKRKNILIVNTNDITDLNYVYPFYKLKDFDDIYLQCLEKPNAEERDFIFSIFLSLAHFGNKRKSESPFNIRYQVFFHLPQPVLIIKQSGEIVMSNNAFNDLNTLPRIFLAYKDNDTIDIHLKVFQIFCRELGDDCTLYVLQSFDTLENQKDKQYRDLGIMTSSLAHEFKNPLAGILAAVNVLELEQWPTESFELICEIKKSAQRSNELVETFLGFSRQQERVSLTTLNEDHLSKFFYRAHDLCKARLVEEQYAMNINHQVINDFDVQGRGAMYTMLFYLYFQDMITRFQKSKLIEGHQGLSINLTIVENKTSFSFIIHSFMYKLTYNRLRNYLAHNLNLTIQKKGEEIFFIREEFPPH